MKHKAFYLNTLWQYGLQVIKYVLPLMVMPYLTRVLEPEGYAVYAYMVSFMTFVQTFVDFGFNLSGTKQIVLADSIEEEELVVGAISQARLVLCVVAAVSCVAFGVFIPIVRSNVAYAAVSFVAVCMRALAPDFLFQGKEQMGPLTTRYLVSKSVSVFLTFILVHSVDDILWIPILDVVASAIALSWSFKVAQRRFGVGIACATWHRVARELVTSAYYCATNMASAALSGVTTLVIGLAITDAAQISYWSLAMSAIGAVQSLYGPIINSLYPHMVNKRDFGFARSLALLSVPFIVTGSVAFYLLSDWIVAVLGGEAYLDGAYVLRLISPVVPLSFYAMFFGWPILGALGRVKELTRSTAVISVLGVLALVGAVGAGIASVTVFAVIRDFVELALFASRGVQVVSAFELRRRVSGH